MTKFYVYPFYYECDNGIMLKNALGGKRIKLQNSNYQRKPDDVIVNWGNSKCPFIDGKIVNHPFAVGLAVNKSVSLDILRNEGIQTPRVTRSYALALSWVKAGKSVVAREKLKGNNGAGIFFLEEHPNQEAKLYTEFVPQAEEFRVNVYRGKLVSLRIKRLKDGFQPNRVRSGPNGYFFEKANINSPEKDILIDLAAKAVAAHSLDFGGVDIVLGEDQKFYVLEVNTAPELQGQAMRTLADFIKVDFA